MTTPRDLLTVAASMCDLGTSEAIDRSIISRAYYAAFHGGLDFHTNKLPAPGIEPPATVYGTHERLILQLLNPTCPDRDDQLKSKAAGYMLRSAKLLRTKADYRLGEPVTRPDATTTLAQATTLVTKLGY